MVVNERPMKRMKRNRVTADLYDFYSFPPTERAPDSCPRPFRESVRAFVEHCARPTGPNASLFPSLLTWQIVLLTGGEAVVLDVVEEDVTRSARSVYCNQCRVVGWSCHPVCRKRYHFIIRADSSNASDGYNKSCDKCGNPLHLTEARCKWCETVVTSEDVEEWVYSQLEDNTQCHLLHGVVHSNGYGHLLRLNGREGGSKLLSGRDIMSFWDRLCSFLSVRKVTVMDVSTKSGTEYRLLHAIVKGHSWYGEWGYEFRNGSYAHTSQVYKQSIETISNLPVSAFLQRRSRQRTPLHQMIAFYQSQTHEELTTLKDLFSFVTKLIQNDAEEEQPCSCLCAWSQNDVDSVQSSLIRVLSASKNAWVKRQSLKGAMWRTTSLELLDYSIKHLEGKHANLMVVQKRHCQISHDFEFRFAPVEETTKPIKPISKQQLRNDLKQLFNWLLNPLTVVKSIPTALREELINCATIVLDCKHFVKDYTTNKPVHVAPHVVVSCHVDLQTRTEQVIPPEDIVLPPNATILNLRNEAAKAFQEVYAMFNRLETGRLMEYGPLDDAMTVRFLLGQSGSVRIHGSCAWKHSLSEFRMERGMEKWVVDCTCGTMDDDGERMLACDTCGVWQHTRCLGIADADDIPNKFLCLKCLALSANSSCRLQVSEHRSDAHFASSGVK